MIEKIESKQIFDTQRWNDIVNKVGNDVFVIFKELKEDLGGRLPAELSYGIVAGYLRGKGFTWEESMVGMDKFIQTVTQIVGESPEIQGKLTITGKTNGGVEMKLEENKEQ